MSTPDLIEVALAGVAVGVDNLAAALALGALGQRPRAWRIALVFAAFGAAMPFVGALLGAGISGRLAGLAEGVGAGVLAVLGAWMVWSAWRSGGLGEDAARRATSGRGLVVLAATLSLDNLAVGFGLGVQGAPPLALALAAGVSVLALTLLGLRVGEAARARRGRQAGLAAGLILLGLAGAMALGWL